MATDAVSAAEDADLSADEVLVSPPLEHAAKDMAAQSARIKAIIAFVVFITFFLSGDVG